MFGKIAALISYTKNLEVYLIKRFPSTKIPVAGMMFTYLASFAILYRWALIHRTKNLRYIRENQRNTAEFYNQRIREYIINNLNSFPEYSQSFGIDVIRPKRTTYFNGIYTSDDCGCSTPYGRWNGDNLRWVL